MDPPTQTRARSAEWPQVLGGYAIQVRWSREPIGDNELRDLELTEDMQVYTVRRAVGGQQAYGLRIGFFENEQQARLVIERLALAPRAGIVPVYETEVEKVLARTMPRVPPASVPKAAAPAPVAPTAATRATTPAAPTAPRASTAPTAPTAPAPSAAPTPPAAGGEAHAPPGNTARAARTEAAPVDAAQLRTLPPMTVDELLAETEQDLNFAALMVPHPAPAPARAPREDATAPAAAKAPASTAPAARQARTASPPSAEEPPPRAPSARTAAQVSVARAPAPAEAPERTVAKAPSAPAPQPAVAKAPAPAVAPQPAVAKAPAPQPAVAKPPAAPAEAPQPATAKAPAKPLDAPAPDAPKPARAPRGDKDKEKDKRPKGHHIEHAAAVALDKTTRGSMSHTDWILYTVLAVALTVGWQLRGAQYIVAEVGLGYALGIAGGTAMLALFLYPVRKRMRARWLGPIRSWFRVHIILGVVGPSLILFHSNFGTGSLNDNVALFAMLVVAGSGFFGRYFYAKIHYGLYGRKATLAELSRDVSDARKEHSAIDIVSKLNERLLAVETEVLKTPETILESAIRPVKLAFKTRWDFLVLRRFARAEIARQAKDSKLVADNLAELQKVAVNHIADRLQKIRKVAEFGFYDKLFSAWHVLHYPFFFVLVIAAVIHVIAVHFY